MSLYSNLPSAAESMPGRDAPAAPATPSVATASPAAAVETPKPPATAPAEPARTVDDATASLYDNTKVDEMAAARIFQVDENDASFLHDEAAELERSQLRDYVVNNTAATAADSAELMKVIRDVSSARYQPKDPAAAEKELRAAFGATYEADMQLARAAVSAFAAKMPWSKQHLAGAMGNDPRMIKAIVRMAKRK